MAAGEGGSLVVNGVDVVPLVDAELNRRFPGRELRTAGSPDELRAAWAALERIWATTLDHAARMPPGAVDASVGGDPDALLQHLARPRRLPGLPCGSGHPLHRRPRSTTRRTGSTT